MNIQTAFPGKYIKAADLGRARPTVTIDRVVMEDVGDDHKPVIYFVGKEKALVTNKTNANMIEEIAGTPETDNWHGVRIALYADKTDFAGKRVDCIRVCRPVDGQQAAAPPPPVVALTAEDIPF